MMVMFENKTHTHKHTQIYVRHTRGKKGRKRKARSCLRFPLDVIENMTVRAVLRVSSFLLEEERERERVVLRKSSEGTKEEEEEEKALPGRPRLLCATLLLPNKLHHGTLVLIGLAWQ